MNETNVEVMPRSAPAEVYSAEFTIIGIPVKVAVLDTGQRLIYADSMAALLAKIQRGGVESELEQDLVAFGRWVAQLPAQPSQGD